ncbi:MAG TPA: MarR family transcriptional regulator [Blastocatellia bacterium]|nr:MarR family transcriptional regulator [Blastocatellia bacterium]
MPSKAPRLFLLLSQAQHRLLKSADTVYKEALGISATHLGVLFILEKRPGSLLKDVSEELKINPSAITGLIGRMEEAGLVVRQPSDDDGRSVRLYATTDGIAKAAGARPILGRLNAKLTEGFDDQEIETVARFLNAILERF